MPVKNVKTRIGRVVSDKMDKSIVIEVERLLQHPLYKKRIKRSRKVTVHDPENQCRIGDLVEVVETRPLSKTKRWRLSAILEKAE